MPTTIYTNNTLAHLLTAIDAVQTNILVQPGQGAQFPAIAPGEDKQFTITVEDRRLGMLEIMLCTARNVDSMTVVRGREGTTPKAFNAGVSVSNRVTAGFLNTIDDRLTDSGGESDAALAAAALALTTANEASDVADAAKTSADATAAELGGIADTAEAADAKATDAQAQAAAAQTAATNAQIAAVEAQAAADDAAASATQAVADAAATVIANEAKDTADATAEQLGYIEDTAEGAAAAATAAEAAAAAAQTAATSAQAAAQASQTAATAATTIANEAKATANATAEQLGAIEDTAEAAETASAAALAAAGAAQTAATAAQTAAQAAQTAATTATTTANQAKATADATAANLTAVDTKATTAQTTATTAQTAANAADTKATTALTNASAAQTAAGNAQTAATAANSAATAAQVAATAATTAANQAVADVAQVETLVAGKMDAADLGPQMRADATAADRIPMTSSTSAIYIPTATVSKLTVAAEQERARGMRLYDPSIVATAEATTYLGDWEAANWTPDGKQGRSQAITALANLIIRGMVNPHIGVENYLTVTSMVANRTVNLLYFSRAPGIAAPPWTVGIGQRLTITVLPQLIEGQLFLDVINVAIMPLVVEAGEIFDMEVIPRPAVSGSMFTARYDWIGFPQPNDEVVVWKLNDNIIAGKSGLSETINAPGGGRIRAELTAGGDAATAESWVGPKQPNFVGEATLSTIVGFTALAPGTIVFPAGVQADDVIVGVAAHQDSDDMVLPVGATGVSFTRLRPEIGRPGGAVSGANYRTVSCFYRLNDADITLGRLNTIVLKTNSMFDFTFWRGVNLVDGVTTDGTSVRNAVSPYMNQNSSAVPPVTAAEPAVLLVVASGNDYDNNIRLLTLAGYAEGMLNPLGHTGTSRYGIKTWRKKIPSGLTQPPNVSHTGPANFNITTFDILLNGIL